MIQQAADQFPLDYGGIFLLPFLFFQVRGLSTPRTTHPPSTIWDLVSLYKEKQLSSVHPPWCYCMLSSSVVPSTSCSPGDFQQPTVLECVKHMTADSHLTPIAQLSPVLNCVGLHHKTTCLCLPLCVKGPLEFHAVAFLLLFPISSLLSPLRFCSPWL